MNANYGIIVFSLGLAGLLLAASRLLRQARADRAARTDTERQLRYSDQLQQLTATLSRARTPADGRRIDRCRALGVPAAGAHFPAARCLWAH